MSLSPPDELTLSTGQTIQLTDPVVMELAAALRARTRTTAPRDLASEIEHYLREHPRSSAIEIARAIRGRDEDVRSILRTDPRFRDASPPPGRSRRLSAWIVAGVAAELVPHAGTTRPADEAAA